MMTYWILQASGIPISCSTVQRLTILDQQMEVWKKCMHDFDSNLEEKFNAASSSDIKRIIMKQHKELVLDLANEHQEFIDEFSKPIDSFSQPHVDDQEVVQADIIGDINSPYLNMELAIQHAPPDDMLIKGTFCPSYLDSD